MKDEYLIKLFQKGRQRVKLLIANPDFQNEVKQIRKKIKIPLDGIKSNKESQIWHHDFYESDEIYFKTNRERVKAEIEKLEKGKKFQEGFNLHRKFNKEAPINSFYISIKNILKEHKLSLNWAHSIQRYILFNSIDLMWLPGNVIVSQEYDLDTDLIKLSIGIDDSTTLDDIKKSWPMIKFHQKKLESYTKKKFQPIKNFERDQKSYNLKQSGKRYSEIAEILSKKFNKIYSYEDVGSFIKRHKQKTGIN